MKIDIPIPCPKCEGKMYCAGYEPALKILKKRSWQICKSCNFERQTEDFKNTLWCV